MQVTLTLDTTVPVTEGAWEIVKTLLEAIGLVVLVGLACKNAILIVEYAKTEVEKGKSLTDAALIGARVRLRPSLMTSFAFVFGCLPLWFATGSGGVSRQPAPARKCAAK